MAQYTVTSTTDLTAKGKRLGPVACFSAAGGTVSLNDGVGGTTRYKFNLTANTDKEVAFKSANRPVFVNGIQVVIAGTDATATLDIG